MEMEKKTQDAVNELFRFASAKDITDHLAEILSLFLKEDIDNGGCKIEGSYYASKVYLHTNLINFIHGLERIKLENERLQAIS